MDKEQTIEDLWEKSNHGTQRQDVVAAYEAGAKAEREACALIAEDYENWKSTNPVEVIALCIRERK